MFYTLRMASNFEYLNRRGLFQFNTLSPNGKLYYKLSTPKDYHWGAWATKIQFFNERNELIYSNEGTLARAFSDIWENLIFVKWSVDGKFAVIHECVLWDVYNVTLLDFQQNRMYRLPLDNDIKDYIKKITIDDFSGEDLLNKMLNYGVHAEPIPKVESLLNSIFSPIKYPQRAKL